MKLFPRFILESEGASSGGGGGTLLSGAGGGESQAAASTTTAATSTATTASNPNANDAGEGARFDFRTVLDDSGNFKPDWANSLPEELKKSAGSFTKYPTPLDLLNGHANAQKLIGQKELRAPAPDAPPEEQAKFTSRLREVLSIPEKLDDYKIPLPEKLPEGMKIDEAKLKEFSQLAHSLNIPASAAAKLAEYQLQQQAAMVQTGQAKLAEFQRSQGELLQKEWGDSFKDNAAKALSAAQALGLDPEDPEIGNNATIIKALFKASSLMKQDTLPRGKETMTGNNEQAEDIRRNPNNPLHAAYMGKQGPQRQAEAAAVVARLQGFNGQ